jgi:GT2 family glycosyltransferase
MEDRHIPIYNQPRGGMMPEEMLLKKTEPFEIAGAGFGFLCVKSGVFENMKRPWFGPVGVENIDEKTGEKTEDFILVGEDLSWCTKAIRAGFKIWVDPLVRVTHQKTFKLYWMDVINRMNANNESS